MEQTKYLVVGSSHAALEAVTAIRMHDPDGSLTLLTRDPHLPYSPTVLPYVVSGKSKEDRIALRDVAWFESLQDCLLCDTNPTRRDARMFSDTAARVSRFRLHSALKPARVASLETAEATAVNALKCMRSVSPAAVN